MKDQAVKFFRRLQEEICSKLEEVDGKARFEIDDWERRDEGGGHGGGGRTRVIRQGGVFEQGGVNFSEVHGILPAPMTKKLTGKDGVAGFFATGVSLVLHPHSPMIPTTHANFRYLEVDDLAWFGGGSDLTPYYLFQEDAEHFHRIQKEACDAHDAEFYPKFKKQCDEYFYLPHRGETRGVGGTFYDYIGKHEPEQLPEYFKFVETIGASFLPSYVPIVERRKDTPFTDEQKHFQLLRRGRYVEFNLIYDRGTLFGLQTNGRTESILMSLPPEVRWSYNYEPKEGSKEAELIEILKNPRDWLPN